MEHSYCVIMAGGRGERFWPLSTKEIPKPFVRLFGDKTMIQMTIDRVLELVPKERIFVVLGREHEQVARRQLPDLGEDQFIVEPVGRDTAACIGLAATLLYRRDPQGVMIVLPADHYIPDTGAFVRTVSRTVEWARRGDYLVTVGINPTRPDVGYGYIRAGETVIDADGSSCKVDRFVEKPNHERALQYLSEGIYYWNSGMFVWRCDTVLNELAVHLPGSHKGLTQIAQAWGTPQQESVLRDVYPRLPKISIDYAVMEPASQEKGNASVVVVEMPVEWTDVGSWPALAEILPTDEHNNAVECKTGLFLDSDDNVIFSLDADHLISTIGLSDMIVVHSRDVTLICPKDQGQRVKELVAKAKEKFGDKFQ